MGALLVGLPVSYLVFHKLGYWVDFLLPVLAICFLGIVAEAIAGAACARPLAAMSAEK